MGLVKSVFCECPPPINYDDLVVKPVWTPLDKLGFPQRLCWCCKIGVAVTFICLLSFFWGFYELINADKFMESIFLDRGKAFFYFKMAYLLVVLFFVLASSGLLFGIIVKRHEPVNVYLWYSFLFNFLMIATIISGFAYKAFNTTAMEKRYAYKTICGLIWCCLFFYMLMVVNSYKLTLW